MDTLHALNEKQVIGYREDGYLSPVKIISGTEAADICKRVEALEKGLGGQIAGTNRSKLYLKHDWIYQLAITPRMLDVAEDLIGPDILLYYSNCWFKNDRDEGYVTRHP